MRAAALSAVLIIAAGNPAGAAEIDSLQKALGHLPEAVLTSPQPELAQFVDMGVLRDLAGAEVTPRSLDRARLGRSIRAIEALGIAGPQAWSERAGIAVDEVDFFLGFGQPPQTMTIWGLESEAVAETLMIALGDRDFAPADRDTLGNGEPMAMDPTKRDPASPWRSMVGSASFVRQDGNAIVQGPAPEAVAALAGMAGAADTAIVATALAGLSEAGGSAPIVQAMLVSPAIGLGGLDPAALMTPSTDLEAMKEALLQQVEAAGDGIPPYFSGIVADIAADQPAVAISLAYPDCDMAEHAAELLGERWASTMPDAAQGQLEGGVTQGMDALCAATLTITATEPSPVGNPIFDAVLNAHMRGSLAALQISASPAGEEQ